MRPASAQHPAHYAALAQQARALFVEQALQCLAQVAAEIESQLSLLFEQSSNARQAQERRDALIVYRQCQARWLEGSHRAWKNSSAHNATESDTSALALQLKLMDDAVVENKILSSRLATRMHSHAGLALIDLQMRLRLLDNRQELDQNDVLRPERCAQIVLAQWLAAGLGQDLWLTLQQTMESSFGHTILQAYKVANEFLVAQGVMPEIDLRSNLKRAPNTVEAMGLPLQAPSQSGGLSLSAQSQAQSQRGSLLAQPQGPIAERMHKLRTQLQQFTGAPAGAQKMPGQGVAQRMLPGRMAVSKYHQGDSAPESRMQTAATPLMRARTRAQGVMGQLKDLLVQHVAGYDGSRGSHALSAPLSAALQEPGKPTRQIALVEGMQPAQMSRALRAQSQELKKTAGSDAEKATIEIVAQMFQSILSEERIPTGVRLWLARLQMPVLRLALHETEFFNSVQHPARRLIDRLGSCVLGFHANVESAQLQAEIKRIVQTVEQYPETGHRVFQLVLDEFEKFLAKFLTEDKTMAKVVSLAQQVEQKETAAIQYTIELRKMLGHLPMPDTVREFLFKVWAEVLAIGAMKNGPQHAQTLALKQVAADLLSAVSVKHGRAERAQLIANLPDLFKRLRAGMALLGLSAAIQDAHIKALSANLTESFTHKAGTMDHSQVSEVAQRIKHLEDFVSEEVGDLPLDTDSIELMLGIDMRGVEIINEGGSEPTQAMRQWAMEIERGCWFHLDHKGQMVRVQYAWRSTRGQLFLFADAAGMTYLLQHKRLAAYLQAGLMTPVEDDTLTIRATRVALGKLQAKPQRLLDAA